MIAGYRLHAPLHNVGIKNPPIIKITALKLLFRR